MRPKMNTRGNLFWGLLWGIGGGAVFSAIGVVAMIVSTSAPPEGYFVAISQLTLATFAAGILGGVTVGLARPYLNSILGASAGGMMVVFVAFLVFRVAEHGFDPWGRRDTVVGFATALVLGLPLGNVYRRIFSK